jgi:hypothetical protein
MTYSLFSCLNLTYFQLNLFADFNKNLQFNHYIKSKDQEGAIKKASGLPVLMIAPTS